ncbi:MAG: hypothetical protein CL609_15155 [Anaerolineaceae bacterium]|nr:hypothetical protein [Anaerolineaceae bacterium]
MDIYDFNQTVRWRRGFIAMITMDKLTACDLLMSNIDLFFGIPKWNNVCHQFTWNFLVDEKKFCFLVIWVAVHE